MYKTPLQYSGKVRSNLTRVTGASTNISSTDTYRLADTDPTRRAAGFVLEKDYAEKTKITITVQSTIPTTRQYQRNNVPPRSRVTTSPMSWIAIPPASFQ